MRDGEEIGWRQKVLAKGIGTIDSAVAPVGSWWCTHATAEGAFFPGRFWLPKV
jgi:hypothetical protein